MMHPHHPCGSSALGLYLLCAIAAHRAAVRAAASAGAAGADDRDDAGDRKTRRPEGGAVMINV